jgi:hypothetical protein
MLVEAVEVAKLLTQDRVDWVVAAPAELIIPMAQLAL